MTGHARIPQQVDPALLPEAHQVVLARTCLNSSTFSRDWAVAVRLLQVLHSSCDSGAPTHCEMKLGILVLKLYRDAHLAKAMS